MSADNYYIIRNHPAGGFAAVMGFESDGRKPKARRNHQQFATVAKAVAWACGEYSEYGVWVHEETKGVRHGKTDGK